MPVSRKELFAPGSDEEFLSLAAEGDLAAFERLVRKIEKPLTQYAHRLGAPMGAIESCLEATVVRLTDRLEERPLPERLGIWAFRAARSTILKSAPAAIDPDSPIQFEDNSELDEDSSSESFRQRFAPQIRAALLSLTVPYREAIVLKVFHGLSLADIARITGSPPGTIYYSIQSSLASISRRL